MSSQHRPSLPPSDSHPRRAASALLAARRAGSPRVAVAGSDARATGRAQLRGRHGRRLHALAAVALASGVALGAGGSLTSVAVSETTPPSSTTANPAPPLAATAPAEAIGRTTATLKATVTPRDADTTVQFEYGTTTAYGLTTPAITLPAGAAAVPVQAALAGLTQATTYHYRVVATNPAGVARGVDRSFSTWQRPSITSRAAWEVGGDRASVGATINARGAATTYRFQWGLTSKLGRYTPRKPLPAGGDVFVGEVLGGLKPNTKYYFRATASNAVGTTHGYLRSFTTPRTLTGVTAQLSATKVTWGEKVTLTGSIAGGGAKGTKLSVMRVDFPFTGPAWQMGTATANSAGNYRFTVGPLYATTRLYVVTQTPAPLTSPTVTAGGAALARLRVDRRRATQYRLRGLIYPSLPGARVSIQRQTPKGRWVRLRRIGVQQAGNGKVGYRTWVPRLRGRTAIYRAVILPRDGGKHVTTESPTIAVPARRR